MMNKIPSIPTYVISLERRQDRREFFIKKNKDKVSSWSFYDAFDAKGLGLTYDGLKEIGFDTNQKWKDPMDGQHLSVGGVGCFISHFKLWETCINLDCPIMILEDDVIVRNEFNYQDIIDLIDEGYNLIYPGYAEMGSAKPVKGKTGLVTPDYPYWASSYVITPDSARILVNDEVKHNIIPVDEYISNKLSDLNPIAYEKRLIYQLPKTGKSDVDPRWGENRKYFQDFNIHSYNNKDNAQPLAEFIQNLPDNDVVLYYEDESKFKKYYENEIARKLLHVNRDIIRKDDEILLSNEAQIDYLGIDKIKFMPNLSESKDNLDSDMYVARVSKIKQMLNPNKNTMKNENTEKVFLEIGTSNFDTLIPLINNGWRGYCVEPVSEYVNQLSKLNQNVVLSNCAISSYDGTLKMYQSVTDNNYGWERGVSHALEQQGTKLLENDQYSYLIKDIIEVPCYTLSTYIKRMGITHIDFMKVDVEGHENDIFDAYDWIVKPTFMKIEHFHIDDKKLRKTLENQGYIVYTESYDLYAVGSFAPKIHTLTFGTDESLMSLLYNSAKRHNITFKNLGKGLEWKGSNPNGKTGCGQKINVMREYLQNLPDDDIVMFVDGYDVFISNNINSIMQEYYKFDKKVVFSRDYKFCWPDATLAELYPDDVYLGGGCWIGQVKEMKNILKQTILPTNPPTESHVNDDDDEQLYYTKKYLSGNYSIVIDEECKIFQTTDYYDMDNVVIKDNKLYNTVTKVYPCVYHGNGGSDAKAKWKELYNAIDMTLDT